MSVSRTTCCVHTCKSSKLKDPSLFFFQFPTKSNHKLTITITTKLGTKECIERRDLWERVLRVKPTSKYARVCSKHFLLTDYVKKRETTKRMRLKKTAVPTQNLPTKKSYVKLTSSQIASIENGIKKNLRTENLKESTEHFDECLSLEDHTEKYEPCEDNIIQHHNLNDDEQEVISGPELLFLCPNVDQNKTRDKSRDFFVRFIDNIKTNSELKSLTNFDNFTVLNDLKDLIIKFYSPRIVRLTIEEKIILVMMKLKLALPFRILSFFFKVTPSSCSQIFDEYIFYLKEVLDPCIPWPSKHDCSRNIPKSFSNVRCIVDCTEIEVQVPECQCCRTRTYSHYKGKHTIKFITGISPGGQFTFVSRGYGGRASNKAILEQSGLIARLERDVDKIIVDKGFMIDNICQQYGIGVLRSLETKPNVKVDQACVHVERMNQRLRTLFSIFNGRFLWSQIKNIDHIVRVCGAMMNLQSPIIVNS